MSLQQRFGPGMKEAGLAVLAHPQYHDARRHLIDFLEHHAHRRRARELVIR